MAFAGAPGRRAGEEAFFSPMGMQLPAVIGGQPGGGAPPLPLGRGPPPSSAAAGTNSKLAAQDLYWRWFQMADRGALWQASRPAVPGGLTAGLPSASWQHLLAAAALLHCLAAVTAAGRCGM